MASLAIQRFRSNDHPLTPKLCTQKQSAHTRFLRDFAVRTRPIFGMNNMHTNESKNHTENLHNAFE